MSFINELLNYDSLSIVGLQKNTGKTVSLNYVLDRLPVERKRIAVASIGIDGETTDQVTRTQKPEIYLRQGMYFGTSEMHYRQKRIVSELIDVSDENTSLGRVVTAKALTGGKILLSGPSSSSGLKRWMKDMHRVGIELVIIDGALSRMSLASPAVSQSMILATGAAYSTNMNTLVQQTAFVVDLIKIPLTEEANLKLLMPIEKGVWYIDDEGALHELSHISSLSQDFRFEGMDRCKTLYVAGALVDGFLCSRRPGGRLSREGEEEPETEDLRTGGARLHQDLRQPAAVPIVLEGRRHDPRAAKEQTHRRDGEPDLALGRDLGLRHALWKTFGSDTTSGV